MDDGRWPSTEEDDAVVVFWDDANGARRKQRQATNSKREKYSTNHSGLTFPRGLFETFRSTTPPALEKVFPGTGKVQFQIEIK